MKLKNHFAITGIGSMPHATEKEACDIVFSRFGAIPFWPQLVNKSFLEDMTAQFSERMPGIEIDPARKKVFVNKKRNIKREIEELNEKYASGTLDYFSFSEDYASGFYEYLSRLKKSDNITVDYLKGQITGPISFCFTITDEEGTPLFFDEGLREAAVKTLCGRARWQAWKLKNIFKDVVIFIDEPSLVFFKHSAANSRIKKEDIMKYINRVAGAIHTEACFAGIHCCGDADWDLVLSTDADIVSIDAYNHGGAFLAHSEKVCKFLERGGIISWGLIPTASNALAADDNRLAAKLEDYLETLSRARIDRRQAVAASLITPSCGCGALTVEEADAVARRCVDLSRLARERIT